MKQTSIENLLPCPFCGSQPEWINEAKPESQYYIRCSNGHCHVTIKADRRDKAIGWWNSRVKERPVTKQFIEEAAEEYALTIVDEHEGTPQYICFIAGAKWMLKQQSVHR